eukprot:14422567-Heterocapsa_arctica.AAC.1
MLERAFEAQMLSQAHMLCEMTSVLRGIEDARRPFNHMGKPLTTFHNFHKPSKPYTPAILDYTI